MPRPTSPTTASGDRPWPSCSGPAAAGAPGASPATTRTRRRWASRPHGSPSVPDLGQRPTRCGSPPRRRRTWTRRTPRPSTPRCSCRPRSRRSTSAGRCARGPAPSRPPCPAAAQCSSWRPTSVTACRRVPTSRRVATARRPSSSATATGCWPSTSAARRRRTSSSTAGGRPASRGRGRGRNGSARRATSPSAATRWDRALKNVGLTADDVDRVAVSGMHQRAVKAVAGKLGLADGALVDDLSGTVGQTGTAHPLLLLAAMLEDSTAKDGGAGRSSRSSIWPTGWTSSSSGRPMPSPTGDRRGR